MFLTKEEIHTMYAVNRRVSDYEAAAEREKECPR